MGIKVEFVLTSCGLSGLGWNNLPLRETIDDIVDGGGPADNPSAAIVDN